MRTFVRYFVIVSFGVALIILIVLQRDINHMRLLHKLYIRESNVSNTNRDATCQVGQFNGRPTLTCTFVKYYQIYNNTSQVTSAAPYVILDDDFYGRLGNQMFKYASILGIARAQGRRMFFHPKTNLANTFKISQIGVNESSKRWPVITEVYLFEERLLNLPMHDVKIDGYLQSFWYFAAIVDEIRHEFTFHDSIANEAANILRDVYAKYNSSMIVGVHVRRGDFLEERLQRLGYGVPEKTYFMKAFSLMKSMFPGRIITFLVASDDLRWCSENLFDKDVSVMPSASDAVHLATLASCDHMIISGGSFGWWSGWLANGHVIYYTGHMRSGTPLGNWFIKDQYYPRMWIGLGN